MNKNNKSPISFYDLSIEKTIELENYIDNFITIKEYIDIFISQNNLDEYEIYEKIEEYREEAMSRQHG